MREVVHNAVAGGACMSAEFEIARPLPGAAFGAAVKLAKPLSQKMPEGLPEALAAAGGLLLIPGLHEIVAEPELLVGLSRLFGSEVEDYRYTLTSVTSVHTTVPEIFMVSNMAPVNRPPPKRPDPPLTADGGLPVQYPHRKGCHTDQSYRRPPPDISLFYAVTPVARDRGQTLFADCTAAYAALPSHLKAKVEGLQGLHCQPGRSKSSRRMHARNVNPSSVSIRSRASRRYTSANGVRWTGMRVRSSACSPARMATAPLCWTS